ncbi:hypothetical protein Q5O14_09070 [Eubacteriaceae bacterium ES2]|nr:hypothetical protein Q5O14_09070 [Eubacteriaceae bacterium ES2]
MKISQELLVQELSINQKIQEKYHVTFSCEKDFSKMKYGGICNFEKQIEFYGGTLYLMNAKSDEMIAPISNQSKDLLFCLINGSESQIRDIQYPVINLVPKAKDMKIVYHQIFAIIYGIFQKYSNWQDQMNQAVENETLQKLLEISYPIFNRSIYAADDKPEYLAAAGPCLDYRGSGSQIPLEIFNYLKNDLNNRPPNPEQKPFIYPRGILCADSLCLDIFIKQDYFCRLILIDEIGKSAFLESDYYLLEILGRSFTDLINRGGLYSKKIKSIKSHKT